MAYKKYLETAKARLAEIREAGLYKDERVIASPQAAHIRLGDGREVINMCANNYLGLADNPEVIRAAHEALDKYGFGCASVRFICGTQTIHKQLEAAISKFLKTEDTILYGACFDANGGLFECLLKEGDAIISDELNHASIIDGVRLCKATRYRYKNNDMADLEAKLQEARAAGAKNIMIFTDGSFSMDGVIANLKGICDLADKYDALVGFDECHSTGCLGATGRGTHEYWGVMDRVDVITGTLGNGLASLTFNKHYKEQRALGRRGLIHGITSGVTGVVMDPIRGMKKSGVKGAVEGVGMGLIGVVTKPISGLLDDTTRLLDTTKEVIVNEKRPERLRLPRCVLCDGVIRSFDEHAATGQMLFFTSTTRYLVERGEKEQYVFHCTVDNGTHYLVVTQYHCFLLSPTADLLWYVSVQNLNIEVDEEEMRLLGGGESKLVLFADKDICSRVYGILINMTNWTNKEIVQCSKDFVKFVDSRSRPSHRVAL